MVQSAEALRTMLLFSRDTFESMLRSAIECYARNDFRQAETILIGLMALDETDPRPLKLLGSTLLLQDHHSEAEAVYERAYALDPSDPYTLVALGEIKLRSMRVKEAVPLFTKLFEMDRDVRHPATNRARQLVAHYYKKIVQQG